MASPPKQPNTLGVLALVFVLLVDAGLIIWYWHWKRSERGDYFQPASHLYVPQPDPPAPALAAISRPESAPGRIVPEPSVPLMVVPERRAGPSAAAGPRPDASRALSDAASVFVAMQRRPRYKKSSVLREWTRDFLSYPDLKQLNANYWKNRNVLAFVTGTVRSPNFAKMVKHYAASPDLIGFVKDIMSSPAAMSGARALGENPAVMAAVKDMTLPGLPSIGTMMSMGRSIGSGPLPSGAQTVENMRNDPNVRKYLDAQGAPPAAVTGTTPRRNP